MVRSAVTRLPGAGPRMLTREVDLQAMEWWCRRIVETRRLTRINRRHLAEPVEVEIEQWHDPEQGASWYTARSSAFLPHGWGKTAGQALDDFADAVERHLLDLADLADRLNLPDLPELVELRARFVAEGGDRGHDSRRDV